MKKLEKLCLKGISEILSEKELKNVLGGSSSDGSCGPTGMHQCSGSCPDVIDYWTSDGLPVYKNTTCVDTGSYCACV